MGSARKDLAGVHFVISHADPELDDRLAAICGLSPAEVVATLYRVGEPVEVALRPLGGRRFRLRPGTSDVRVLDDTFNGLYHLPPGELSEPRLIVDLGANIGTTMAHFAYLYPSARVFGVELDAENAELCRLNVAAFGPRCVVLQAAVGARETVAKYTRETGSEWAYRIDGEVSADALEAPAVSLDSVLASVAPGETVDYLKVDIEGTERELFEDALVGGRRWPSLVRCLKVEVHAPYELDECAAHLAALGFEVARDDRHPSCCVAGR